MKRLIVLVLVLMISVSIVFVTHGQEVLAAESGEIKLAIILKTLANDHWVAMKEGALAEGKKLGVTVDVFAVASEGDIQQQLQLFETALEKDYQGISISPITPLNLVTAVVKANKRGIPVINVDEGINLKALKDAGGSVAAFIRTDNFSIGEQAADFIASKIPGGGEVVIIEGMAGNTSGDDRRDGFKSKIETYPEFKLVASQPGDWDRIKALDVATNMINRYSNLKAIYCANDTMALGAVQAVKNAKKTEEIIVVGTDGIPEAVKSVKAGEMAATIAQDPYNMGTIAVAILVDIIKENKTEADKFDMLIPSKLIEK